MSQLGETVDNIGSVHVLGEQVSQRTMVVADGGIVTGYCRVPTLIDLLLNSRKFSSVLSKVGLQ